MASGTIRNKQRPAEVLLVEDNRGDVVLTKKAFATSGLNNNITVAMDGEQALSILHRLPPNESAPVPDLILLDLNLPKKSGRDILQEIKSDEKLKHIPVVVLTSSRAEMDVVKSYDLHANSYVVKPIDQQQLVEIAKTIEQFWFNTVVLADS